MISTKRIQEKSELPTAMKGIRHLGSTSLLAQNQMELLSVRIKTNAKPLSSILDSLEKQPVPLPAIQDAQASAEIHARVKCRYKTT